MDRTRPVAASPVTHPAHDFLAGGGEMGARIRRFDWRTTPLGDPAHWPQSLKTIVRVMLDSRYAMWMLWGPQLTFLCNDAYLPTLGIKGEGALGARSDKVWEEIWPDIGPRIDRVLQSGEATWDEALLLFLERRGYPEETYHTFSYSPVYGDDSCIAGMLCVVTEVTERVIGERRLTILRDLAARAGTPHDVDTCCRRAIAVLERYPLDVPFAAIYLMEPGQSAARRIAATLNAESLAATLGSDDSVWPVREMLAHRVEQEIADLPAAGIRIHAGAWPEPVTRALIMPLKAAGHEIEGFVIAGFSPRRPVDDSGRSFIELVAGQVDFALGDARAYAAERKRTQALAELDRAKTAFFSNVSHEFRTPLTLMLGPLGDAIGDGRLPADLRERLNLAQRNAGRLQRLVNSLLDFSRIEAGRVTATFEATDLAELTRDIASNFRSAMEKAGLEYRVECTPIARPVYVDREMWEKIVLNLVSNAFKFTFDGRVCVRVFEADGAAVLEVQDTGVGIPEAEMPQLFERFHRVEGTTGRTHEGSGIGLALVQELVKLLGGTIAAQSRVREGTSFTVRIPTGKKHIAPGHIRDSRSPAESTSAGAYVEEALRWFGDADGGAAAVVDSAGGVRQWDQRFADTFGATVILADDNADMRSYLRDLLAPLYKVAVAANGEEALKLARDVKPDVILSDVMMPRLDGFGFLKAVRADPALSAVPFVLLSARAGEESRIEGFDAGADDYLVKPFTARELLARVGALVELRRIRRQAEEQHRVRTAQYETLLNAAPLGVFLVDSSLRVVEANPTALALFDPVADVVGRKFSDLLGALVQRRLAVRIVRRFRETLETGRPYGVTEQLVKRLDRGPAQYYEWQIHRIPLPDGSFGVVCYFREITAHVRARDELESASRQKDQFLAMLAHELRNPLAPIRSAGELLGRGEIDVGTARTAADIVRRQVTNLTRLVDDLLDVSRITRDRIELQRQLVTLDDALKDSIEIVQPLLKEKRHELVLDAAAGLNVFADRARIVQCIANVLTNAAKYTDAGGRIEFTAKQEEGHAVVSISDNGMGIPDELLPRVFDLFVQGDRALDRAQGGLGIGLSIVKRIIEMHGGTVNVASGGANRGSLFTIRLPLADAASAVAAPPLVSELKPQRILVVDDNVDAADSLAMMLRMEQHLVRTANSAARALEEAHEFKPAIALLDIGLPGMDGYELARRIRADAGIHDTFLIALTGYGQADDRVRSRDAGFDLHLVKPADMGLLQAALRQYQSTARAPQS